MTVLVSMNATHDELMEEAHWWLSKENIILCPAAIQAEETKTCRWALYSTNQMNREALTDEISRRIGLRVAMRWRIISTGKKTTRPKGQSHKTDEVRAIHFGV